TPEKETIPIHRKPEASESSVLRACEFSPHARDFIFVLGFEVNRLRLERTDGSAFENFNQVVDESIHVLLVAQCLRSLGGNGSLPGATVSESRQWPFRS